MALKKENTTALGLHLVAAAGDNVLTYSDQIADINYEHIGTSTELGAFQNVINKELRKAIVSESEWYENNE